MNVAKLMTVVAVLAAAIAAAIGRLGQETFPALPEPVTNNAVAVLPREDGQALFSFMGLGPGKEFATIYDFIAVPDMDELSRTHPQAIDTERRLVRRELKRINKFAALAINHGEALEKLRVLKKKLHLMDM